MALDYESESILIDLCTSYFIYTSIYESEPYPLENGAVIFFVELVLLYTILDEMSYFSHLMWLHICFCWFVVLFVFAFLLGWLAWCGCVCLLGCLLGCLVACLVVVFLLYWLLCIVFFVLAWFLVFGLSDCLIDWLLDWLLVWFWNWLISCGFWWISRFLQLFLIDFVNLICLFIRCPEVIQTLLLCSGFGFRRLLRMAMACRRLMRHQILLGR